MRRRLGIGFVADTLAAQDAEAANQPDLSKLARANVFSGFLEVGPAALHRPVLNNPAVFSSGSGDQSTLTDIMRARFFKIHVFACLTRADGYNGVPMIGSGYNDSVDIFILQYTPKVCIGFRRSVLEGFNFLRPLSKNPAINVTYSRYFGATGLDKAPGHGHSLGANAYRSNMYPFVGAADTSGDKSNC